MSKHNRKSNIITSTSNKEYVEGMQQLRQSGAAGVHQDRRTKRKRTRSAQVRAAINEYR